MPQTGNRVLVQRRQSVLPTTSPVYRSDLPYQRTGSFEKNVPNATHESAVSHTLRRMSNLFKSQGPTEVLKTALGDPNRIRFMQLSSKYESLASEWKHISHFLNSLIPEYAASKGLDPFRRYKKLQSLAKRIVFHLKLTNPTAVRQSFSDKEAGNLGSALQSSVKLRAMRQRHETICDGYSSEALVGEIRQLERINEDLEVRINDLVEAINALEKDYRTSKNEAILRRYHLLKTNLKIIFAKENLR